MEVGGLLAMLRRWWWALLLAPVVGSLVGFSVASGIPPTYVAQTRLLVGPLTADESMLSAASRLTETYGELVTSDVVLQSAAEELGVGLAPSRISVSADNVTRLVRVRVSDNDPETAASIANTLADQLVEFTGQNSSEVAFPIRVVDLARPPETRDGPNVELIAALAGLAAFMLAVGLVLLIEYFDTSISNEAELAEAAGREPLGAVVMRPRFWRRAEAGLVSERHPDSPLAAAYRLLATKVEHCNGAGPVRTILVTSASKPDNIGQFSANLAATLAMSGRTVALVDAHPEAGGVTRLFALHQRPGLGELLMVRSNGNAPRLEAMHPTHQSRLAVVPQGDRRVLDAIPPHAVEHVLSKLLDAREVVILDAGPVTNASCLAWAGRADAALLVAQRNRTTREDVQRTVKALRFVGSETIGPVLLEGRSARRGTAWLSGWRTASANNRRRDLTERVPSE